MELLETSNERFEAVNQRQPDINLTKGLMRKITRHYETLRLLADDDLHSSARAIWDGHTFSANALSRIPASTTSDAMHQQKMYFISIYRMEEWELQGQHQTLTEELKRAISKKRRFGKSNQDGPENVEPDLTASSQITKAKTKAP